MVPFLNFLHVNISAMDWKLEAVEGYCSRGKVLVRQSSTEAYGAICTGDNWLGQYWSPNVADTICQNAGFAGGRPDKVMDKGKHHRKYILPFSR